MNHNSFILFQLYFSTSFWHPSILLHGWYGGYIHSPTGRHMSCFKYFVIANSTCLTVHVYKGFSESLLNDIARPWDMYIFDCPGRPNCFLEWLAKLYFHQQGLSVEFLPVLTDTWYCGTLRFLSGFQCEIIPHWNSRFRLLNMFIGYPDFSSMNCIFRFFAHFLLGCLSQDLWSVWSSTLLAS